MISSRRLQDTSMFTVLFWYLLLGVFLTTSWLGADYLIRGNLPGLFQLSSSEIKLFAIAVVLDGIGQTCQVRALQIGESSVLGIVGFVLIFYAFSLDYLLNGETYTKIEILASFGILITALTISWTKLRPSK